MKKLLLIVLGGFLLSSVEAETILNETFETDGAGTRYSGPQFTDGSGDYCGRFRNSDVNLDRNYTNVEGSYWFGGQDHDGDGQNDEQVLSISNINISGYTELQFAALFAESRPASDSNDDIDAPDYIHVLYQIDGGGYQNLLWFENDGSTYNTTFRRDTDFDGTGETAPQLETAFADFTNAIAGTGSALDIQIRASVDAGDEDWAIDDIRIMGTSGSPAANEPPVLATIGAQQVMISNTLQFAVTAADPVDGDTISLTASNLPSGALFSSTNENGTFTWPNAAPTGTYTIVFTASDKDGIDSENVEITVNDTVITFRMMAANLSSQTGECDTTYQQYANRIFQGLKPDIVGIQEWNVTNSYREFVDQNFGTGFSYYVEDTIASCSMPNGIISRWPIIDSGEWTDYEVYNRDFAWATIRIPSDRLLHVISVHFKYGTTPSDLTERTNEAATIISQIHANFSSTNYIALIGDLNTQSRSEQTLTILGDVLTDEHKPADQNGDRDTNSPRNEDYDYILPNPTLNSNHVSVVLEGVEFQEGLVFDSRLWSTPPSPIQPNDSAGAGIQHMAVIKDFSLTFAEQPPLLIVPADQILVVSNDYSAPITAEPSDGDTVTLSALSLPPGSTFGSTNEVGTFTWQSLGPIGVYTATFQAADNDGVHVRSFTIEVIEVPSLLITEIADPGDNYNARFVELYNMGSSAVDLDAEEWYFAKQTGDSGNWSYMALSGTIAAATTYVIGSETGAFKAAYGFDPDAYRSSVISGNGDDVYALYKGGNQENGALVDIFGVINQDGTGKPWEYTDSRAARSVLVSRPSATWASSEWTIVPADAAQMTPGLHAKTPPMLAAIANQFVEQFARLQFDVSAIQTEGDSVTLSAAGLPSGATFASTNGAGSFVWHSASPIGVYTTLFYAADIDGVVTQDVRISVTPPRDIVICEIMQNPSAVPDTDGEWLELYNRGSAPVDIDGYILKDDGSDKHTINNGGPLIIETSGFLVLGRNGDSSTNGNVAIDYVYSGTYIANGADEVVLLDSSSNEVARVNYDGGPNYPNPVGASMFLISPDADPQDGANWKVSSNAWVGSAGDYGSPGSANEQGVWDGAGNEDSDSDGIPDDWELDNFGNLTMADGSSDTDGDGMPDVNEWAAGTQPTNTLSLLQITRIQPPALSDHMLITFDSVAGKQYDLLRSTNVTGPYIGILSNIPAFSPANTITDNAPPSVNTFYYRIRLK